jgi:hypothetical protein
MHFKAFLVSLLVSGGLNSGLIAGEVVVSARDQNAVAVADLVVWITPLETDLPPLTCPWKRVRYGQATG